MSNVDDAVLETKVPCNAGTSKSRKMPRPRAKSKTPAEQKSTKKRIMQSSKAVSYKTAENLYSPPV